MGPMGGAPFRFAQSMYPAVLGGGLPAPGPQAFPQAFQPSAGEVQSVYFWPLRSVDAVNPCIFDAP